MSPSQQFAVTAHANSSGLSIRCLTASKNIILSLSCFPAEICRHIVCFFLVFHRFSVDFRPFQAEKHSLILLCAVSTTRRGPRASRDIELVAVIRQLDHQHLVAVRDEAAYAEACLALLELGPKDARNCLRIAKKHQKHIKKNS